MAPSSAVRPGELGPLILFVDDDELMRELGRRMLEPEGFEILLVESAEEAVRRLAQLPASRPVVLVTDSRMPGMTGDQLILQARAMRPFLPIPSALGRSHGGRRVRLAARSAVGR